MNLLQRAIDIATRVHANQVDKGGAPYINHPLRVMEAVYTTDEKIVAVLHDTIEDSEDPDSLLQELHATFPPYIIEALQTLTHLPHEPYDQYIERVLTNPLATRVKLEDVRNNMRPGLPNTPANLRRYDKYKRALDTLWEGYRLRLIADLQPKDVVYPIEDGKLYRITRCTVSRRTPDTVWVRGAFWGLCIPGERCTNEEQEFPFDRYGEFDLGSEQGFNYYYLLTQREVDEKIADGAITEERINYNTFGEDNNNY